MHQNFMPFFFYFFLFKATYCIICIYHIFFTHSPVMIRDVEHHVTIVCMSSFKTMSIQVFCSFLTGLSLKNIYIELYELFIFWIK